MSAWQRLLAASSLAVGTAWDLITNPKTGGAGVVVNTGAVALVPDTSMSVAIADAGITVALVPLAVGVPVADSPSAAIVPSEITVQISTQPITV